MLEEHIVCYDSTPKERMVQCASLRIGRIIFRTITAVTARLFAVTL